MVARRKKPSIIEGETVEIMDESTDNEDIQDEIGGGGDFDDYLHSVFSEVGDDVKNTDFVLKFYQVQPNEGALAWCFSCVPSELPVLDRLRDEYGGGKFEVRIYKGNRIFRRKTLLIKAPIAKPKSGDNGEMVKIIMEGFNKLSDKMGSINSATHSMPQIIYEPAKVMEAMATMMTNLQIAQQHAAPPPVEQPNTVELLLKGMEMAAKFNNGGGGGGNESTMLDVLRDFLKSPLLETVAAQQKAAQPRTAPHPQPQPQPQQNGDEMEVMRKQYINMLLDKARQGSSPELYAEYIIDNVPEEYINQYFTGANVIDDIVKLVPAVDTYRGWFTQLKDTILELLSPDDIEVMAAEDAANVPVNTPAN